MAIYDPYAVLGVSKTCTFDEAKKAYRKLASKHHPDKGGDTVKFQEIQEAYATVERYFATPAAAPAPNVPPAQSSFTAGIKPKSSTPFAGKPAPGYEAVRKPIVYPHTKKKPGPGYGTNWMVELTITREQAERGCTVPFWHDGSMRDYVVPPFSHSHTRTMSYPLDAMIGRSVGTVSIEVQLTVEP